MKEWEKDSWQDFEKRHLPNYEDENKLRQVLKTLESFPPLVFNGEIDLLNRELKNVAEGKSFLLQGGDCAESFSEFSADNIRDTFRIILQMAIVLTYGLNKPVVKLGRMAGQFAKPRTSQTEEKNGEVLPSYFGDMINDYIFSKEGRSPDPNRMLKAYSQSASTLNLLRSYADGGFADLKHVHTWNMGFVDGGIQSERYKKFANQIRDSLNFMESLGINSNNTPQLRKVQYYTSHEALLLPYEQSMVRLDNLTGQVYSTSAHFLWIGDRTRFKESAHVEFCRGLENPIGIKCGPKTNVDDLKSIISVLNPNNTSGKITLIARFGYGNVEKYLPNMISNIDMEGFNVIWSCDPMHGNTRISNNNYKTRTFESIVGELKEHISIHEGKGTTLGGVHLEMTGQDVTECIGGVDNVEELELSKSYQTLCDPRLNANQAIEMAFLISDNLRQ